MKLKKLGIYFLIIISALSMVFNVWIYSSIFYLIENRKKDLILPFLALILAGYVFFGIIEYIKELSINKYIADIMKCQKLKIFENILYKNSSETNDISDNISLINNDFKFIENNYYIAQFELATSITAGLGSLIFALYNNFALTFVFIIFGIIPILTSNLNGKKISLSSAKWSEINENLTNYAKDFFKNKLAIKIYNSEKLELENASNLIAKLEYSNADRKKQVEFATMLSKIIGYSVFFLPIVLGIYFVIQNKLTLSNFVAVQYSSSWIVNSFIGVFRIRNKIRSSMPVFTKISKILDEKHNSTIGTRNILEIESIEFKNVSFKFKEKVIFNNINLVINKGDKVLIKGESGSGKTTFLKLLLKIVEPTSGSIYINGKNINELSSLEVMSCYGLINQAPFIFNDTILKNITFGIKFSEEEIEKAVKKAGLQNLIKEKGYDYIVGEEGKFLSGGQLKRIDIARAMLFKRETLLVDELNSSLDENTAINIIEPLLNSDKLVIDIEHHTFGLENRYNKKIYLENENVHIQS